MEGLNDEPLENNPPRPHSRMLFSSILFPPVGRCFFRPRPVSLPPSLPSATTVSVPRTVTTRPPRQMARPSFCFKARANNRRITGTKRLDPIGSFEKKERKKERKKEKLREARVEEGRRGGRGKRDMMVVQEVLIRPYHLVRSTHHMSKQRDTERKRRIITIG